MSRRAVVIAALVVAGCGDRPVTDGVRAREAFVRRLAEREGLSGAWHLMSRAELQFADGLSPIYCVDPYGAQRAYETGFDCRTGQGAPVRWMGPAAHLRVRGRGPMRLWLRGRVNLAEVFTRPTLTVTYDGAVLWSAPVGDDGGFLVEAELAADQVGDWAEVYLVLSSVGEPWRDPARLAAVRLDAVGWEPTR